MSCSGIKHNLVAYIGKELSPAMQKEIEIHLASCTACRELVAKMATVYSSYDSVQYPELSPYFYSKVLSKLEKGEEKEYFLPIPVIRSLRPIASGLLLLSAITFGVFFGNYLISSNQADLNSKITSASAWANEYYLDNNEDTMVDLIISNEK